MSSSRQSAPWSTSTSLLHLDGKAKLLGLGWLTLGVLYLTYLTRGFRRPPPEMDFVEE